jgi:GNAT superfamily N-acetyltransferase
MPGVEVRALAPTDERHSFRCGNADLDRFFQRFAGQNQFRHHIGTTWVALDDQRIVGFATVSAAHLELDDLPVPAQRGLPRHPLPVLRLARLAVDETARGQGLGRLLLKTVFLLAREMSARVGCVGVVVDAKAESVGFYETYGFEALKVSQGALEDRPEPTPMFLPLTMIPAVSVGVDSESVARR